MPAMRTVCVHNSTGTETVVGCERFVGNSGKLSVVNGKVWVNYVI